MYAWVGRLLREPLLHFLIVGAFLYGLFAWFGPAQSESNGNTIRVDRPALLRFMQFRAKAFDAERAAASLDAMNASDRQQLIDEFVREEVLYREARALGLDRGDDVLRQRLVQKMQFVLEDVAMPVPTQAAQRDFFAKNLALYRVEESYTFTHVFVDPAERGVPQAAAAAEAQRLLQLLRSSKLGFNDAPGYGDRFAYLQNYVERTTDYIRGHFGPDFLGQLQRAALNQWQGPWRSEHGWHLVLIVARQAARDADFADVQRQVIEDLQREQAAARRDAAIRELRSRYTVQAEPLGPVSP